MITRVGKLNPEEFNILLAPFIGGLLSPEIELFPTYDQGYFTLGKTKMVVSSGLGNGVFPIRFLNKPELCIVTLVKNK